MFEPYQYQLLDFGNGRKLERFGAVVLDRQSQPAERFEKIRPLLWDSATVRYVHDGSVGGAWTICSDLPKTWTVTDQRITLELSLTRFGQVGAFAEQASNWDWIDRQVRSGVRPLKVLNLFGYTGGSTLSAAQAGAEVTHVDSAKNVVAWAKRNAEHSGLSDAPIRWIVEDAVKFVTREIRRKKHYDAIILDPPSFGRGPRSQVWKLTRDLLPLLRQCAKLTGPDPRFVLATCHTTGFGPPELEACIMDGVFQSCRQSVRAKHLFTETNDGRRLPCGVVARWPE